MKYAQSSVMFKEQFLKQTKDKIIACKECTLHNNRKFPVVGHGSHSPVIMFIGEAIGDRENETGMPFSGNAKETFEKALEVLDVKRMDVYSTVLLKCKYEPSVTSETCFKRCLQHLITQIDLLQPKIICTMGHYPTKFLLEYYENENKDKEIKDIHGESIMILPARKHKKHQVFYSPATKMYIVPTFSPATKDNFQIKDHIISDMNSIKTLISLLPILF